MKVMTVAGPGGLGDLTLVERDEPTPAKGEAGALAGYFTELS